MEKARAARLTRYQHILLRLGELIAYAECAGAFARRAARFAEGKFHEKAHRRFHADGLAALARIFAREAALKVASDGLAWVVGAGGIEEHELAAFEAATGCTAIHRAQAGLIRDMDLAADAIYNREAARTEAARV